MQQRGRKVQNPNVALNTVDITSIAAAWWRLTTLTMVLQAPTLMYVLFVDFMFIPMVVDISNLSTYSSSFVS